MNNQTKFIRDAINSCTKESLETVLYEVKNNEYDEDCLMMAKMANYAARWLRGDSIPPSVLDRVSKYFRSLGNEYERVWLPLVEAIEKRNPELLKEL